jgi:hypothetical protein
VFGVLEREVFGVLEKEDGRKYGSHKLTAAIVALQKISYHSLDD